MESASSAAAFCFFRSNHREILLRFGVIRIGAKRRFELGDSFLRAADAKFQDAEIVVRFGKTGIEPERSFQRRRGGSDEARTNGDGREPT